jgi:hypothetical protein
MQTITLKADGNEIVFVYRLDSDIPYSVYHYFENITAT